MNIPQLERERLALQRELDAARSSHERNRLGQFATPPEFAAELLASTIQMLPRGRPVRFLDPAFGTGAFYQALLSVLGPDEITAATAYEIDPHYGIPAQHLWQQTPLDLWLADFTRAEPPEGGHATLLVCNPPYVRHHHLAADERQYLRQAAQARGGMVLSGLAGLYCYFMAIAHAWLAHDGLAAWLIPSEFMDVNYGRAVKDYLLNRVTLLRIHRVSPDEVQFDDALVSSAIVWFRKTPPPVDHTVAFTFGGTLQHPDMTQHVPAVQLARADKWTRFPAQRVDAGVPEDVPRRLSDLFTIRRGLATGANGFFVLAREQAIAHQLPAEVLTPILPSARLLAHDEILAGADGYPLLERQLVLVDCALPEEAVRTRHPALWRYLQAGAAAGVSAGYLCRHRSPWYAQEQRPPAPLLCTYMGRGRRPFRFILNHSRATAPNVYLMLYPKPVVARVFARDPGAVRAVWHALNALDSHTLIGAGRVYGGGLHKLEPKELANVPADALLAVLPPVASSPAAVQQLALFEPS